MESQKEERLPTGYWRVPSNQRHFLERIGKHLGVQKLDDWYGVSRNAVREVGGQSIFKYFSSLEDVLRSAYPNHSWKTAKFAESGHIRPGHWQDKTNLLEALHLAEEKIGITKPDDWYSVTMTELRDAGCPTVITKPKLAELLSEKYPDYSWEKVYLLRGRYAHQKRLERAIASLFPNSEMRTNARKEADLINPETGEYLELDIYIPSLKLAFEYNEKHHYMESEHVYHPLEKLQQRDQIKQTLAAKNHITLITIPFWWDGKADSLISTIKQTRHDLLTSLDSKATVIPNEMPQDLLQSTQTEHIEDIGVPITACFMTQSSVDPTNWWMFEKYDGVRGFWNPLKKAFYSRIGNRLPLPQEVLDAMPQDMFLDGELWFGKDNFQESMKISNRVKQAQIDWQKFRYMVFDVPNHTGTYEERYNLLVNTFSTQPCKYVEVAPMVPCLDMNHLEVFFQDIIDRGGEGIILRDPSSSYQSGRSKGFLKHKKFRDAEAKIIGRAGNHQWECELPDGVRFTATAGTSEFVKRWDPQPGDIVSFKHRGFLLGTKKPKLAALFRLRPDLTWDNVVDNWKDQSPTASAGLLRRPQSKSKPKGHWLNIDNRIQFFSKFAQEMGFDPYQPENWANITNAQIVAKKGKGLLFSFGGSLKRALKATFPDMEIKGQHDHKPKGYWADIENRRQYFRSIATEMGFDPNRPETWKDITRAQILSKKGSGLLANYNGVLSRALSATFPEFEAMATQ